MRCVDCKYNRPAQVARSSGRPDPMDLIDSPIQHVGRMRTLWNLLRLDSRLDSRLNNSTYVQLQCPLPCFCSVYTPAARWFSLRTDTPGLLSDPLEPSHDSDIHDSMPLRLTLRQPAMNPCSTLSSLSGIVQDPVRDRARS